LGFKGNPDKQFARPYLEKNPHKKGLVKWLKVWALSLSPSSEKKKTESQSYCGFITHSSNQLWSKKKKSKESSKTKQNVKFPHMYCIEALSQLHATVSCV
jgi:hypothetical protein